MTKFNKPFIEYKLKDCKKDIIKDKTNHHTHYIIQKHMIINICINNM